MRAESDPEAVLATPDGASSRFKASPSDEKSREPRERYSVSAEAAGADRRRRNSSVSSLVRTGFR